MTWTQTILFILAHHHVFAVSLPLCCLSLCLMIWAVYRKQSFKSATIAAIVAVVTGSICGLDFAFAQNVPQFPHPWTKPSDKQFE
jgi:membrane-bound metal-dependent hydrolase YbcI (DUF457 family)